LLKFFPLCYWIVAEVNCIALRKCSDLFRRMVKFNDGTYSAVRLVHRNPFASSSSCLLLWSLSHLQRFVYSFYRFCSRYIRQWVLFFEALTQDFQFFSYSCSSSFWCVIIYHHLENLLVSISFVEIQQIFIYFLTL
jgi:hypothetical protein